MFLFLIKFHFDKFGIFRVSNMKICRSKSVHNFQHIKTSMVDSLVRGRKKSKSICVIDDNANNVEIEGDNSAEKDVNYWPNCDATVWLRSCENEVIEPIHGKITGSIPKWLKGTLLRNGPGCLKVGDYSFEHLFDSSALLHRFAICDGDVTYQRRFVQTDVFKKNRAAQRIVVTEFGTKAVPDPCQTIFRKVATVFTSFLEQSDNSMISIYPFDDEYYTFTETPIIHRIDPENLETTGKVIVSDYINIVSHSSHPHVMNDGTVYNLGLSITPRGPCYIIICFSPSCITVDELGEEKKLSMFDQATIVASVPARWKLNPSYMHTFGVTENYFIVIEQPLAVSLIRVACRPFTSQPMATNLKWHDKENTLIHVISRETGEVERTFVTDTFFFLHIINQFETRDREYVVVDVCCYRDAKMLDCMYVEMMKNIHKNPDYPKLFRSRPLRFVLPMKQPSPDVPIEYNLIKTQTVYQSTQIFEEIRNGTSKVEDEIDCGCVIPKDIIRSKEDNKNLLQKKASAHRLPDGVVFVKPELLCDLGCETPRVNYDSYLGREYRFFYAISTDVDLESPGMIIKVDTMNKSRKIWTENNAYPSEPIFVPDPNGKSEDDGLILSALIWGESRKTEVALLILDAKTLKEIARVTFDTPGPVPKCLHGWFTLDK